MTRLRSSSFGEARSARSRGRHRIPRACLAVAAQLRRRAFTTAAAVIVGTSAVAAQHGELVGDTSMMDGAQLGILMMLAITFAMQGAFVGFFLYLRRRAKRIADIDLDTEWSEVQKSPRRS